VHLSPGDAQVWFSKAEALLKVGRYLGGRHAPTVEATDTFEKALGAYEQAIDIEPNFPEACYGKGAALGMLDRREEALEAFDEAIEQKADYQEAWLTKGMTLVFGVKRPQAALDALDEAIRLDPRCPRAWMYKGRALFDLGLLQGVPPRLRPATDPYQAVSAGRF